MPIFSDSDPNPSIFDKISTIVRIFGFPISELIPKKSIPHGPSGQTHMWKMISYGFSNDQVRKLPKYLFFTVNFKVSGKNTFSFLGRLMQV